MYQLAYKLAMELFRETKSFPKDEKYSLTDQIRRSARSIGAQISEAWAKRQYEKHFLSKLTDSDGEQQETQHWIGVAFDCDYLSEAQGRDLVDKCLEIGRMLGGMMSKSELFCRELPPSMHEEPAEYVTNVDD